jgi:OCT family organic cation transporter-like MFS transporter 4/5
MQAFCHTLAIFPFVACSELFPTLIRSAVLGYQNQAARVGGIIAPFIVMAGATSGGGGNLVPFATFGAASLLAGLLIFSLPETLGVPLPDTLQVGLWFAVL